MAGKQEKIRLRMIGLYKEKKRKSVLLFLFIIILSMLIYGKDALIIVNPAVCELYDQYEQLIPPEKRKEIVKNAPFEIINEKKVMGDQITYGIQLSLLGNTCYLLLDEKGKISGLPSSAGALRYKGCKFFYDTLCVLVPSVKVYSDYNGNIVHGELKKNETVIRVFTYRDKTFIFFRGNRVFTGWVKEGKGIFGIYQPKKLVKKDDDYTEIHARIVNKLNDANNSYRNFFEYFNKITGSDKTIPQWKFYEKERKYVLTGSKETTSQLNKSTEYLINEIKKMVEGRNFIVVYKDGEISVVESTKLR